MARSASHQSVIVCQGGYNRRSVWSMRVVRVAVAGDRAGGMHGESLLLTFPRAVLGGNFSQFQERGATNVGNLRATSDTEMRKIGPSPAGCGENRAILRCLPRLWTRHSLRPAPHLHPTDEVRGDPGMARFSLATLPARKLIAGSR